jgi:hypothetical protein
MRSVVRSDHAICKALETGKVVFIKDMLGDGIRRAIEPRRIIIIRNLDRDDRPGADIRAAP